MGDIRNYVRVNIVVNAASAQRPGYGIMGVLVYTDAFSERSRIYGSLAAVADDIDDPSDPAYLAAAAAFSQEPAPQYVKLLRGILPPTQMYELEATVDDKFTYLLDVAGAGVTATQISYTTSATETDDEDLGKARIHSALLTGLNGVVGKNYTAAFESLVVADFTFTAEADDDTLTRSAHGLLTGDGPVQFSNVGGALPTGLSAATDYWAIRLTDNTFKVATSLAAALAGSAVNFTTDGTGTHTLSDTVNTKRPSGKLTVTGSAAGAWFSLASGDIDRLSNRQVHTDPGVATDLIAINRYDRDWYGLYTLYNSKPYAKAAADWAQANRKLYLAESCDSSACTTAAGTGNNDLLETIKTEAYSRVGGLYHPSPAEMFGAGEFGRVLALDPGKVIFALKKLVAIAPVDLTDTHRTNLVARRAMSYETVFGINTTFGGQVGDPNIGYLDNRRDLDWMDTEISASLFEYLTNNEKVSGTDAGIQGAAGELRSVLKRGVAQTIVASDPAFTITAPKQADRSNADKSARRLTGLRTLFVIQGAIQEIVVDATVTQ